MRRQSLTHCGAPICCCYQLQGISTPQGCFPEFNGDGARSYQTWDLIAMSDAALSPAPAATKVEACQAACAADPACQYYVFRAPDATCLLRNKVPYSRVNVSDASKSYAVFEVGGRGWVPTSHLPVLMCAGHAEPEGCCPLALCWCGWSEATTLELCLCDCGGAVKAGVQYAMSPLSAGAAW